MNTLKTHANNIVKHLVNQMVKKDLTEWPPGCMFGAYQPLRPYDVPSFEHPHEVHIEPPPKAGLIQR